MQQLVMPLILVAVMVETVLGALCYLMVKSFVIRVQGRRPAKDAQWGESALY